jgi:hypothetical protein
MTDHIDIYKCVEDYYNLCLSQEMDLLTIMDQFRTDPLPIDVLKCGSPKEIRRIAQIIATDYLIKQQTQKAAALPESDLLNTVH